MEIILSLKATLTQCIKETTSFGFFTSTVASYISNKYLTNCKGQRRDFKSLFFSLSLSNGHYANGYNKSHIYCSTWPLPLEKTYSPVSTALFGRGCIYFRVSKRVLLHTRYRKALVNESTFS